MTAMVAILDFLSERFYFVFYLQVALMLPIKFGVNWLSVQEKKRKIDFQDGGHHAFPIGTIVAIFYL